MPSTINGIGTWYWGRNNLVTREDTCEFCGHYGQVRSYDTTLFFVVIFIPLIPLGKKRILDECKSCTRHRSMGLGKWTKLKDETILQKTEAWQADRSNKEKASEAIGATIAFHDAESFNQLAPAISDGFARDADVQILLGDAYDHFGDIAAADTAYRAAVVNRPDDASREAMAKFMLRQGRPAEAQPLLRHILDSRQREKTPLLLALAQSYQAVGDHDSAAGLIDEMGTTFPDLLSDPDYERIRKSSSKYRGTDKRIGAVLAGKRREGPQQTSWFARHAGGLVIATLLLIAAVWYLGVAWSLGKHRVTLVNGTTSDYEVVINDDRHLVPARGHVAVEIKEGALDISIPKFEDKIEPAMVDLHTNFWKRPFNRRTFVINPDRTAVVLWEQTEYAADPAADASLPYKINAGEVLYEFDKVDYVFEPFPEKLRVPDKSKRQIKTRVAALNDLGPLESAEEIKKSAGAEPAKAWLERYALLSGDSVETISALATHVEPKELIAFLRAHLGERPVRIEFHRLYQWTTEKHEPQRDLTAEYQAMLDKDPGNPTLMYLLGRTHQDRAAAVAMYRKAADAATPCAYASYALSYDALAQAQFDEALKRAQKARQLEPANPQFVNAVIDALEAVGQYKPAIELIRGRQTHNGRDFPAAADEVRLLIRDRQTAAAQGRVALYCQEVERATGGRAEIVATARNSIEAVMFYAQGDLPAYRKAIASAKGQRSEFESAIADSKWKEAADLITKMDPLQISYTHPLTVFIGAMSAGQEQDIATAMWEKAIAVLKAGDRGDRAFAQALSTGQPPTDVALRNWAATPQDRCIVLTALGLRHPESKTKYFSVAQKLNYSNAHPQRLIAQAIDPSDGRQP